MSLQDYADSNSSSSGDEVQNDGQNAHLKPLDKSSSFVPSEVAIVAAPDVVSNEDTTGLRHIDPKPEAVVGDSSAFGENEGKTVFEFNAKTEKAKKRKREKNRDPSDIDGYLGPWAKYADEETVSRPSEDEQKELDEILAKRSRAGKQLDEKTVEEKTTLHIAEAYDYQGRSFLHPPQDVGVNLRSEEPPEKCFLPKKLIHTWSGHTKGIAAIRWFPKYAHLILSAGMDCKIKVSVANVMVIFTVLDACHSELMLICNNVNLIYWTY